MSQTYNPSNRIEKTRFCPSPTGKIHVANARAAAFNVFLAMHLGGTFLLRIEDTDVVRSKQEYVDDLLKDLRWLDLHWQEGPESGGDKGPYYQSQRQSVYDDFYAKLLENNKAYPCFCTGEALTLARKQLRKQNKPPRYLGTCRHLTPEAIQEKEAAGLRPTLRFAVPAGQSIEFVDFVKGPQTFNSDDIGDFIIRRANKTPPFLFCNAVDDALMGVTYVLRGEDHLANTPRQLMILAALGLPQPKYGHMPLIVGKQGSPLSKRHGEQSIEALRDTGFLPIALLNCMARLGHHYQNESLMTLAELGQAFQLSSINTAPAHFNLEQLRYWQKQAVLHLDESTLWHWMGRRVHTIVPSQKKGAFIALIRDNILLPEDAILWAKRLLQSPFSLPASKDEFLTRLKSIADRSLLETMRDVLIARSPNTSSDYLAYLDRLKEVTQRKGKALLMPLRLSLTGVQQGPDLSHLCAFLGLETVVERLNQAMDAFNLIPND